MQFCERLLPADGLALQPTVKQTHPEDHVDRESFLVPGADCRGSWVSFQRVRVSSLSRSDSRKKADLQPVSVLAARGHHVGFLSLHVDSQAAVKDEGRDSR